MRVVILGAGLVGSLAAARLGRALGRQGEILLVPVEGPDDSLGPFGAVEVLDPAARRSAAQLHGDEAGMLVASRGSFALGTAYSGWAGAGAWFAPFGDIGAPLDSVPFEQLAARLRAAGRPARLSDFSLGALAAQMSRFARPPEDESSVFSTFDYGLHVDRDSHADFLRGLAEKSGLSLLPATFAGAELGEHGISALRLADGGRVAGDLFLDCSGPRALLLGEALGVPSESWDRWLPCDRVLEISSATDVPPAPYAHVAAHAAGYRRTVPANGRVGEAMAYAGAAMSDDAAQRELRGGFVGDAQADVRLTAYLPGRRRDSWHLNCVALGAAAAVADPLQPSAMHLLCNAIDRLLRLFPPGPSAPLEAAEHNRESADELDRLRDFLIARYRTNRRLGEPFWDALRTMNVPDTLGRKLALYESRCRIPLIDGDLQDEQEWIALLDNHGVRPRRYDALADAIPQARIERHFARIREVMLAAAASLPLHADYLRSQAGDRRP